MESLGLDADIGPWAAAFVLAGVAALITLLLLRPDPQQIAQALAQSERDAQPDSAPQEARPLRQLLLLPSVQLAMMAMLISQLVMVTLMLMTPLHMHHQGHGRAAISLVIGAHTLGMFGLSAVTGYLIDRYGRIPMLVLAAALLIISALMAPFATNELLLAAALFLLGLGWNFGYVAGSALMAGTLQGAERARVQGVNDSLVFFVAGLGSLGAGPLFAAGGFVAVSTAGIVFTLLLLTMTYRLTRPQLAARAV
jgi:predicted MFS family arabinose efflux permease